MIISINACIVIALFYFMLNEHKQRNLLSIFKIYKFMRMDMIKIPKKYTKKLKKKINYSPQMHLDAAP